MGEDDEGLFNALDTGQTLNQKAQILNAGMNLNHHYESLGRQGAELIQVIDFLQRKKTKLITFPENIKISQFITIFSYIIRN